MSSRTRAELVIQALEDLAGAGTGQTPQVEDTQRIDDALPSIIAMLRSTEVYYLNDIDSIPDDAFMSLAAVIAWEMRAKFSVTDPTELQMLKQANDSGRATLKIIVRSKPTFAPLKTEFF